MSEHTPAHGQQTPRSASATEPKTCRGACASASAAMAMLERAASFIQCVDDASYAAPSSLLTGGTIGKHFRHVVDHFAAALAPFRTTDPELSLIDYDHRERNVPMETSRDAAIAEIQGVLRDLAQVGEAESARPVRVRLMLAADGTERIYDSTLGREIAFASHHAVHHHAMIEVIAGEVGVSTPPGFGKAPSTLNFERSASGGSGR